jgi:large subunit ribosomal protein L9
MQVILLEDLAGKGVAGEVVKVANGYARNYLLPRNIAIPATDANVKSLEHRRAKLAERKTQSIEQAEALKAKIDSQSITFEARSGEGGRLFGSITSQDVADAIQEHFDVFIDKRKITDGTPIKSIGVHSVSIKLYSEVTAVMRILVGTPEQIEAAEEAARVAAEKAAAKAAAEAEAAARAEAEAAAAAEAADAASDAPDYDEDFAFADEFIEDKIVDEPVDAAVEVSGTGDAPEADEEAEIPDDSEDEEEA